MASITYKPAGRLKNGSEFRETRDGMFRVVCSNQCEGIPLPTLWIVFRWRNGSWRRSLETRSRRRAEKHVRSLSRMQEADV